jgi:hypothetical protein
VRTYEISINGFDGVQRIQAENRRQAQYRSWQHAVDAGYRITFIQFAREWVKSVRLS